MIDGEYKQQQDAGIARGFSIDKLLLKYLAKA